MPGTTRLSKSNLFLIISGSHLGMMYRQVLSYQAPLYGRSTANLLLQPLPFGVTRSFYPNYAADERVAVYAMLGGVPAYWERFNPEKERYRKYPEGISQLQRFDA